MKSGVGFLGLLGLLFIGLKLAHQIDWSWWWILLPIYFPFAVWFVLAAVWFVLAVMVWFLNYIFHG